MANQAQSLVFHDNELIGHQNDYLHHPILFTAPSCSPLF